MDTLFVPNEDDFRRWIREAVNECLENPKGIIAPAGTANPEAESLFTRKEVTGVFPETLVTLHDWMKKGLPCHKQEGRSILSVPRSWNTSNRNATANIPARPM